MKTLWAPWRQEYVQGRAGQGRGCIFEAGPDQPHCRDELLLYRDAEVVVLLNRFPYANGHLLVAPARHAASLQALTATENNACMQMLRKAVMLLEQTLQPDGFNIGLNLGEVAGAGLADHLHWHIVPRWQGDHNFMAVLAEIRTVPEHILHTFDRLLPGFQALAS